MFRPVRLVEMGSIPHGPMGWSWILSAPRGQSGQNGWLVGENTETTFGHNVDSEDRGPYNKILLHYKILLAE